MLKKEASELNELYRQLTFITDERYKCAYCGYFAEGNDHIVPASFFGRRMRNLVEHKNANNIVRACRECNSLASNKLFENFWKKKEYLAEKVEDKWWKIISMPNWKDEEIDELDYSLKVYIHMAMKIKKIIEFRLKNLNSLILEEDE